MSTILQAIFPPLIGALIGGIFVKLLENRKERFLLREKWISDFRIRIESFLDAIEIFRLSLFWGENDQTTNYLRTIFKESVRTQLMTRNQDLGNISKEENLRNEIELNALINQTQKQLDQLWGEISRRDEIKSDVVAKQNQIIDKAVRILNYNWNKIENGLDPLNTVKHSILFHPLSIISIALVIIISILIASVYPNNNRANEDNHKYCKECSINIINNTKEHEDTILKTDTLYKTRIIVHKDTVRLCCKD